MSSGYLCITREPGERILIEGGIVIRLGRIRKGAARILIQAPGMKVTKPTPEQDAADRLNLAAYLEARSKLK